LEKVSEGIGKIMIKWNSRKFLAFAIWAIITLYALVFGIEENATILQILQHFSTITMIYMLGQSAIDGIDRFKNK